MGPHPLSDGIQDPGSLCLRDLLLILVIAIYLAVQITVPAIGLLERGGFLFGGSDLTHWDRGHVRFGWQMFSTLRQDDEYDVVARDGSVRTVSSVGLLGRIRGRAHYADLAEDLCGEFDSAVAIRRGDVTHRC